MLKRLLSAVILGTLCLANPPAVSANPQVPLDPMQLAQASAGVSGDELAKFANAFVQIKLIERQAVIAGIAEFQAQGFSQERFEAIARSQQSQTPLDPALTEAEKEKIRAIRPKMDAISQQVASQMGAAVEAEGLTGERYREIVAAVRQSPELQAKVEQLVAEILEGLGAN